MRSDVERYNIDTIADIECLANQRRHGPRGCRSCRRSRENLETFRRHRYQTKIAVLIQQDHLSVRGDKAYLGKAPILPRDLTCPRIDRGQERRPKIAAAAKEEVTNSQHVSEVHTHLVAEPEFLGLRA